MIEYAFFVQVFGLYFSAILLGYWTYLDASDRGSDRAVLWALTIAIMLVPVIVYLPYRSRIGPRSSVPGRTERAVGTVYVGCLALLLGPMLSPPDPFTSIVYGFALVPVLLVVGYLLVWRGGWARVRRTAQPVLTR